MDRVLFKRYMEELQEMEENMEALNKAFRRLDSDFVGSIFQRRLPYPLRF